MKICNTKVRQVNESKRVQDLNNVENLWKTLITCGEVIF